MRATQITNANTSPVAAHAAAGVRPTTVTDARGSAGLVEVSETAAAPAGHESVDEGLAQRTAQLIDDHLAAVETASIAGICRIIVGELFGESLQALARIGERHATLRRVLDLLGERGANVGYVQTCLRALQLWASLPEPHRGRVTLSHAREMLGVADPEVQGRLAVEVAEKKLSRHDLADAVRKWREMTTTEPVRGRPPDSPLQRLQKRLALIEPAMADVDAESEIGKLGVDRVLEICREIERVASELQKLLDATSDQLDAEIKRRESSREGRRA